MAVGLEDRMAAILPAIGEYGLPLVLAVRGGAQSLAVVTISESRQREHDHDSDVLEVHPDSTVGMFIACVWRGGGSATFHVAEPSVDYELELV